MNRWWLLSPQLGECLSRCTVLLALSLTSLSTTTQPRHRCNSRRRRRQALPRHIAPSNPSNRHPMEVASQGTLAVPTTSMDSSTFSVQPSGSVSSVASPTSTPNSSPRHRPRTISKHAQEAARMVGLGMGRPGSEGGVKAKIAGWEQRRSASSSSESGSVRNSPVKTTRRLEKTSRESLRDGSDEHRSELGSANPSPSIRPTSLPAPPLVVTPAADEPVNLEASQPPLESPPVSPSRLQPRGLSAIPEASPVASHHQLPNKPSFPFPTSSDPTSPLTLLRNRLLQLPITEQKTVQKALNHISTFSPKDAQILPLHCHWMLYFSDTSQTAKPRGGSGSGSTSKGVLKASEYTSGMSEVATFTSVPDLCSGLKTLKGSVSKAIRDDQFIGGGSKRADGGVVATPGMGLGLVAFRAGQNLHFFRKGVAPMWEDQWNVKGGRLTIQPALPMLDQTYESLVLLAAGGVLDIDASSQTTAGGGGQVVGIVGSRRSRGDRIEVWISGTKPGQLPDENWIRHLQQVVAQQVGTSEAKSCRYKKHFNV